MCGVGKGGVCVIHICYPQDWTHLEETFPQQHTEQLRTALVRSVLRGLLPENTASWYRWCIIPCGRGAFGLRLAIIETVRGWDGVRVWLISGGWLLDIVECASEDGAEAAAWAFDWRQSEQGAA